MTGAFHIAGAEVLRACGLSDAPIGVENGLLSDAPDGRAVHLPGWWVLPGIVDVHGDGFERHLAPRRGALRDLSAGLMSLDAELAANGITTAVLAQFYSWEGGMRGPDFARAMLAALDGTRGRLSTEMMVQLRVENHLIDAFAEVRTLVADHSIRYVVMNDHLPHEALDKGKRPPRLTGQALKSGRSPEAHQDLLNALHARCGEVPERVAELSAWLAARGVLTGSHDDRSAGMRQEARAQGLRVCEFPETRDAAEEAERAGEPVVLGAPNVVRGGSHAGQVAAVDLVRMGLCTALASDYHYPAPLHAALSLVPELGLEEAWGLVSSGPARLLGLADRGRLAAGMRADLIALNPATGRPGLTVCGGRISHADPAGAAALLAA